MNTVKSPYLTVQLETVIVISEIASEQSEQLLIEVLTDTQRDNEIRAGAAWGLGEFRSQQAADTLIKTFNENSLDVKVEAARALLRIAKPQIQHLTLALQETCPENRGGIAWALARTGAFDIVSLASHKNDTNLRHWLSYIVGYGKESFSQHQISALCETDAEVYFAASVLWQLLNSWIYNLREY